MYKPSNMLNTTPQKHEPQTPPSTQTCKWPTRSAATHPSRPATACTKSTASRPRLHSNHHSQLRVAWVPAHSRIWGNEWAHNEARAAISKPCSPIASTTYSGPHFDSSQPGDTQPDLSEGSALAKLKRKKILLNLRTPAFLFNRHNK
ncbi:hypothetical protein ISCGN_009591 [Ixodes scapularis]